MWSFIELKDVCILESQQQQEIQRDERCKEEEEAWSDGLGSSMQLC